MIRHHKGGIEPDAELADDIHRVARVVLFFEGERAALGDGAEVFVQLVLRHADAVVRDGQGSLVLVRCDADFEILAAFADLVVRQREEIELIHRVAGVADELTQEDLFVRVDAVDHQVENAPRFRLELFFCHEKCASVMKCKFFLALNNIEC
ncbi:hypothetical protein SDC9_121923 [bioreactor metagenome]|uniref:Uncharacterized protein n=1 Tax=bioreactor metagenome TaxID=1076179 RepID=A0A645CDC3_9ZZZZ